jgi:hypothetical protein
VISSKTTDAVKEQLADYLRARTEWDEVPAVFTLHEVDPGRVRMVQLPVPDDVWAAVGHPPTAVAAIAGLATGLPRQADGSHCLVIAGVGRLIGAAFHYEAYALAGDSSNPAVEEALRRRAVGGSVPRFEHIPGRIEQRCLTAVDLDGGRYMVTSSRIDESKPDATDPVVHYLAFGDPNRDRLTGNVVDAVNRLLNVIKPVQRSGAR